jgi:hypothetical protein
LTTHRNKNNSHGIHFVLQKRPEELVCVDGWTRSAFIFLIGEQVATGSFFCTKDKFFACGALQYEYHQARLLGWFVDKPSLVNRGRKVVYFNNCFKFASKLGKCSLDFQRFKA